MADVHGVIRQGWDGIDDDDPVIANAVAYDDPLIQNRPLESAPPIVAAPVSEDLPATPVPAGEVNATPASSPESVAPVMTAPEVVESPVFASTVVAQPQPATPVMSQSFADTPAASEPAPVVSAATASEEPAPIVARSLVDTAPQRPQSAPHRRRPALHFDWRLLVGVALVVVVLSVWFVVTNRPASDDNSSSWLTQLTTSKSAATHDARVWSVVTTEVCVPETEVSEAMAVADFVETLEGGVYPEIALTPELQEEFAQFVTRATALEQEHCYYPRACQFAFREHEPYALAYARAALSATVSDTQQWLAASQLRALAAATFGIEEANPRQLPLADGETLEDVYNAEEDTFAPVAPVAITWPYTWQLESVRTNETTGQRVFIAHSVPDKNCYLQLGNDRCSCPSVRYYLVQDTDPVSGELIFAREYVQVEDAMEKIK